MKAIGSVTEYCGSSCILDILYIFFVSFNFP